MSLFRLIALSALSLALVGCGILYRPDVQQGNVMEQSAIDQLKPGMTKRQVQLLIGNPVIQSPFRSDRWDYVYTLDQDGERVERKALTLTFQEDQLVRIDGDFAPKQGAAKPAE
jgi:outer membrane protein assembly factor BamE